MAFTNTLSSMVQAFASAASTVVGGLDMNLKVDGEGSGQGIRISGCCAAALIGVVGEGVKGSVTIFVGENAFSRIIFSMSVGMIEEPAIDDPMSMSALGELANMMCGSALSQLARICPEKIDITPPQLFSGEKLSAMPSGMPEVKYYTIPMTEEGGDAMLYLLLGFG